MRATYRLLLGAGLAWLTACSPEEPAGPTSAGDQPSPSLAAPAESPASFYFLPPLVTNAGPFTGTFDPDRDPVVEITCTGATGKACPVIASFRRVDRTRPIPGRSLRNLLPILFVNTRTESYDALWLLPLLQVGRDNYELRVYEGDQLLGSRKLWVVRTLKEARAVPGGYTPLVAGLPFLIRFRLETSSAPPPPPLDPPVAPATPPCVNCLELVPGSLLLPGAGARQQLAVYRVDAAGVRTAVSASFESSNPAAVSVSSDGIATAAAASGSSQIVAKVGSETSAPVLAVIATPVANALLISDAAIDGAIVPVDPNAPYKPGWRYHVHLKGVTPAVGQVVLNTGMAAVGGKVVSVTPGAGFQDVVLELLPLSGMFTEITINQQIPLGPSTIVSASAPALTGRPMASEAKVEFPLGPFSCESSVEGGLDFPISLSTVSFSLNPSLTLDLQVSGLSVQRAVAHGTLAPRIEVSPSLTASVSGSVECKLKIGEIIPPIGGPISQIIGIQIPYGIGFELKAEGEVSGMGFDAFLDGTIATSFGFDCTGACHLVSDVQSNVNGSFKASDIPSLNQIRTEVSVSGFGWAELHVGVPRVSALQYDLVDVKAAIQQKAELAGTLAQALDPDYASALTLAGVLEAGNSEELSEAAGLLSISLPELKLDEEIPISTSPGGTLTITPVDPAPGDNTHLGDRTTFTIDLDPTTYAGSYAVDAVEIRWLREEDDGTQTLDPGRPGCTSIAAVPGQTQFTCGTDFLTAHIGVQKFFAFAHARFFGVSFPLPLEIGDNSEAAIEVVPYGHVHRRIDFANGNVQETDIRMTTVLEAAGSTYIGTGVVTYHAESKVTNAAGCTITAIFDGGGSDLLVTSSGTDRWTMQATVSGNHLDTNSCTQQTTSFPFSFLVGVANGESIIRDGAFRGINFRQNTTTSGTTFVSTGKLRVGVAGESQ